MPARAESRAPSAAPGFAYRATQDFTGQGWCVILRGRAGAPGEPAREPEVVFRKLGQTAARDLAFVLNTAHFQRQEEPLPLFPWPREYR